MSVDRRPVVGRVEEASRQAPPNQWTTAAGDTAEVFLAQSAPGGPRRWYWRVVARNSEVVAVSGEGFTRPRSARRALARTFPPAGGAL